jgi:hypothetical protein
MGVAPQRKAQSAERKAYNCKESVFLQGKERGGSRHMTNYNKVSARQACFYLPQWITPLVPAGIALYLKHYAITRY